nr:MAG: cobyrinic acid a,c-diamide synthase [Vulcanisaeta sp. AZ3]
MRVLSTVPRVVVASYKGKVGKTTASLAISMALIKAGYRVSMFKVGPDFIDPSYHAAIMNRPSRNLDYVLMGDQGILTRFHRYSIGSDVAIIEGVSGLYDSVDGVSEVGSTAQVAKLLKAPVILVINGERINRTVRALVRGLRVFDPEVRIRGVVFTNVNKRQVDKLVKAVEEEGLETIGYILRSDDIEELMQYRHLGLVHAQEVDRSRIISVINEASIYIDVNKVLSIAKESEPVEFVQDYSRNTDINYPKRVRIGIVTGRVFTFYYPEVIERAQEIGDVRFLDPEVDQDVGDVDLVVIGGGFPEIYGRYLERNRSFRSSLRSFIDRGGYVYAECGGLMYLTDSIVYNNEEYEMVGAIDAITIMHKRPVWYGYATARVIRDSIIGGAGTIIKGHEFHYSTIVLRGRYDFVIRYERGFGINGFDGILINNAYAYYLHIHPDTYDILNNFVENIVKNKY